ncbi:hypothetical protein OFM04_31490, partial [Escherichia coli]|nr:hypothetical protein [Escherichia coli]
TPSMTSSAKATIWITVILSAVFWLNSFNFIFGKSGLYFPSRIGFRRLDDLRWGKSSRRLGRNRSASK